MRRLMPIKVHYIFMFIPFLNVFVIFMYLFNIHRSPNSGKLFSKSILIFLVSGIIPMAIFTVLERNFVNLSIISFLEMYFVPLFVDLSLIRFQKKNLDFDTKDTGDG